MKKYREENFGEKENKESLKVMAVETERRYKYAETFGFVTIYIK